MKLDNYWGFLLTNILHSGNSIKIYPEKNYFIFSLINKENKVIYEHIMPNFENPEYLAPHIINALFIKGISTLKNIEDEK